MTTYRFNAENYLVPDDWDAFTPRIISYHTFYDTKTEKLSHYFYVEVDWGVLKKVTVQVGDFISIAVGQRICRACRQPKTIINHHLCADCLADEDPAFLTRMQCVFGNPDSELVKNNYLCSKSKLSCQYSNNWKYCSRKYLVYIARFNNLVKVGITQHKRELNRLYEQGIQEAYLIGPLSDLSHAVFLENELAETFGIQKELTRAKKIKSFTKKTMQLVDKFTTDDVQLITDASISHMDFQNTLSISLYRQISYENISGIIRHIFGDIVVLNAENKTVIVSLKDYEDAILQQLIINEQTYW